MQALKDRNQALFDRALRVIPGGVNSPVRAFRAVGGTPRFVQRAKGAYFWDANGQRFIDYIGSWGPMILGHGHPAVLEAVQRAVQDGFSFGAPTEREAELAEEIIRLMPSVEMVRLVSSGTEAAMSAIRLARGVTGRKLLVKFEGCYHGHADALLVKAGSGLATFGMATSAGVPPEVVQHTLVLEYNNLEQLEQAFARHGAEIACLIIEPVAGNMNFVRSTPAFIQRCRALCTQHGAQLIFDEVMTGFRVALGGAQALLGVTPRILAAPQLDPLPVATELIALAKKLHAFCYLSCWGCETSEQAVAYRDQLGGREAMLIYPDFVSWDTQANAELQYQIDHSEDDDMIESVAREKLGLVKPGEKISVKTEDGSYLGRVN